MACYLAYDCALTPGAVIPVKQFVPALDSALAAADNIITRGSYFNLRIEAEDGHMLCSEDEIRRNLQAQNGRRERESNP
jgi:hypothetical protein